jgi:hypothetical protein
MEPQVNPRSGLLRSLKNNWTTGQRLQCKNVGTYEGRWGWCLDFPLMGLVPGISFTHITSRGSGLRISSTHITLVGLFPGFFSTHITSGCKEIIFD